MLNHDRLGEIIVNSDHRRGTAEHFWIVNKAVESLNYSLNLFIKNIHSFVQ